MKFNYEGFGATASNPERIVGAANGRLTPSFDLQDVAAGTSNFDDGSLQYQWTIPSVLLIRTAFSLTVSPMTLCNLNDWSERNVIC